MIVRRLGAAGALLCLATMLGACAPVADFTADHWPHWAGGLPPDAPPRPGAPGYEEFIAHGEAPQNAPATEPGASTSPSGPTDTASPAGAATAPAPKFQARGGKAQVTRGPTSSTQMSAQRRPQTAAPREPVETPSTDDTSVVKGGLY